MIRPITEQDIPSIIHLLLNLKDESPVYGEVYPDFDYVSDALANMVRLPQFIGCIDEHERGCMFGMVSAQWYSPVLNAYDQLLYVLPEYRGTTLAPRLIRCFEQSAKLLSAQSVYLGTSTGIREANTVALYKKLGYEEHGGGLRKRL